MNQFNNKKRLNKKYKFNKINLISILLILTTVLILSSCSNSIPKTKSEQSKQVCFEKNCFDVTIANNESSRESGLMFQERLDENKGMLFVFEKEGVYPFWMKNTLIPLDIIWIDNNYNIIYIEKNALPCKDSTNCQVYGPAKNAKYVLEVNSGIVDKINLSVNDNVKISINS